MKNKATEKKQDSQISFKLGGIEILESCLFSTKITMPDNQVFNFDIQLEHKMNIPKQLIVVVPTISILAQKNGEQLGLFKSSCIYHVDNLADFLQKETNELSLPKEFIVTLNSVSISTTRGMMYSFFRGTVLHNAILPVINPREFKVQAKA